MVQHKSNILFVGNAVMDVLCACKNEFLANHDIEKGGMNLIDEGRAISLYQSMENKTQQSGGSAANTAFGFAALGGKAAFAGQVSDDPLGHAFIEDLQKGKVRFVGQQTKGGLATARSMIFITPDSVRSMNTYLGTSVNLNASHIPEDTQAEIIYLEGYLFDAPEGPAIFQQAADIAKASDAQLALTLSDAWCVERHHSALSDFVREHVSILFSNETEIAALAKQSTQEAITQISREVEELVVTFGPEGAIACNGDEHVRVPAMPSGRVTDTTGAGDLFAAGYLFGRVTGADMLQSAELASMCAGEIICHYGARPEADLKSFITAAI